MTKDKPESTAEETSERIAKRLARAGVASRREAERMIEAGRVKVNGKRVNIPSYQVKDGDVVEVKEKSRELPMVLEALASPERDLPDYIEVDLKDLKTTILRGAKLEDVPYPVTMEPNLVIEFYSR